MENVKQKLTHRQRQALETRKLIVDAAAALFLEQGYAATTIDAIAGAAGVAVSTVYAIFTNKRGILHEIRQTWHAESQVKGLYAEGVASGNAARFLELAAHATRRQWEAGSQMIAIYNSAASADAEAAAEQKQALNGRRTNLSEYVRQIHPLLRQDLNVAQAAAILLALTHAEVYAELVGAHGWSPDEYERWLAGALKQQLLPPNPES
jgi:AcrR family transcriptional regulator